jgi:CBS domain-containing protein
MSLLKISARPCSITAPSSTAWWFENRRRDKQRSIKNPALQDDLTPLPQVARSSCANEIQDACVKNGEFIMKKCNEVMTKNPVYCLPDDMVAKVAQLMQRENIGSIPVIENEQTQKLVGIVTDRDLALKVVAKGQDANSTKVEAVMTHKVVTCRAGDDLQMALDAMAEHQLRRIPIVDNDNKIVGIIAQADVATRVNLPEKTATVVKEISQSNAKQESL